MSKRIVKDDIDRFMDYGIYVPTRTIYIGSEETDIEGNESGTDAKMAEKAVKALHILDVTSSDQPITVIMNNFGGDVNHGMAIYDSIKKCKNKVIIKAIGSVMSMGSIIFQAGDERIMSRNAVLMIHHGEESFESSHPKAIRNWVEFTKKFDEKINNIYLEKIRVKHPDFSIKKLDKMLNFDTLMTAEEAVELGLADKIED